MTKCNNLRSWAFNSYCLPKLTYVPSTKKVNEIQQGAIDPSVQQTKSKHYYKLWSAKLWYTNLSHSTFSETRNMAFVGIAFPHDKLIVRPQPVVEVSRGIFHSHLKTLLFRSLSFHSPVPSILGERIAQILDRYLMLASSHTKTHSR